jgi:hypothetical protein
LKWHAWEADAQAVSSESLVHERFAPREELAKASEGRHLPAGCVTRKTPLSVIALANVVMSDSVGGWSRCPRLGYDEPRNRCARIVCEGRETAGPAIELRTGALD